MEAALAELNVEDVKDEADDKDFIIVRGEYFLLIPPSLTSSQTRRTYLNPTLKARMRRRTHHSKPPTLEKSKLGSKSVGKRRCNFFVFFQLIDLPSNLGCAEPR
jgi:hypothetical protein